MLLVQNEHMYGFSSMFLDFISDCLLQQHLKNQQVLNCQLFFNVMQSCMVVYKNMQNYLLVMDYESCTV